MKLVLTVDGATEEELKRGAQAAIEVFNETCIDPVAAAEGRFALEGWDIKGFPKGGLSDAESRAASAWFDAERSAIEAACADWPEERRANANGCLELLPPDDEQGARDTKRHQNALA